jgi:hypothetical protein
MLNKIRSFIANFKQGCVETAPEVPSSDQTDFGHGYKARQLIDGHWVLEFNGKAVDRLTPFYAWNPDSRHYLDCMFDTLGEVQAEAKSMMAMRGV